MFLLVIAALVVVFLVHISRRRRSSLPYPPTPPGQFILGNLKELQRQDIRKAYGELAAKYGDIFHLSVFGQHVVFLNSVEVADELLSQRSQLYSDRARIPMVELMGWDDVGAALMPYGEQWRAHRRLFQQGFNPTVVKDTCHPIQSEKIGGFLNKLLTDSDNFLHHTEVLLGAVVIKYVYGRDISLAEASEDVMFRNAAQTAKNVIDATIPGSFLVNTIPALAKLPEWFPACGFHTFARETKEMLMDFVEGGYQEGLTNEADCLVKVLESFTAKHGGIDPSYPKNACGAAYAAAAETTKTTLTAFFFLMRQHPHIQLKAYDEITRVIGCDKIPEFTDRASLPYIQAVYLEVMRWMPALPFSQPHATIEDDVYRGYFIPKGTIVMSNLWSMRNDDRRYPNPRAFRPERFLTPDGNLALNTDINSIFTYGFGRRVCAGRHFADALVWKTMACVLASFFVEKVKDDPVDELEQLDDAFIDGAVAHAVRFRCSFVARTPAMAGLIRSLEL